MGHTRKRIQSRWGPEEGLVMIKINVKLVQDYSKPVTNVQLVDATWIELWTRNASAPTTLELTQGGKEEASGSDRKAFCFSQWHCCPVSSCTLPCCFSECYVALTVELCALTFRHRDCPALHCSYILNSVRFRTDSNSVLKTNLKKCVKIFQTELDSVRK